MNSRLLARLSAAALCLILGAAMAQTPPLKRIERADDLPRFSYKVEDPLETIIRDRAKFEALAAQIRRDTENTLATHDIVELATRRGMMGILLQIDMLEGKYDAALARSSAIRELQEKPADKLMSGLVLRSIIGAIKRYPDRSSPAYGQEVARLMREELDKLPFLVVRNDVLGGKAGMQTLGEALIMGRIRDQLQPVATRAGALSSDLAPALIGTRFTLEYVLPIKDAMGGAYAAYIDANNVDKPDIWKARDVALPAGRAYKPVNVVVWDSGVDTALFPGRLLEQGGKPAAIAFDKFSRPSNLPLVAFPDEWKSQIDMLQSRSKGLSDLQSNVDSPEAAEVRKFLSTLTPAQYKPAIEQLRLTGNYQHGTHVAGIAMEGNPYARIGNARIEFGHTLLPDPCPSKEDHERGLAAYRAYVDFIKSVGARVVNMSWGGNVRGYEVALEQCGIGKDPAERKALARAYFDSSIETLRQGLASAPEVLFVVAAGNSGNDPTFNEFYPSSIVLPNVVVVGAVDKAGDEASFTSYGPTVALHANGYQVESYMPGGKRVALSGTSMAAPQVTNLAAKILTVNPALKPAEVIDIMRRTAEKSADGRRTLVHPAKALAAAGL